MPVEHKILWRRRGGEGCDIVSTTLSLVGLPCRELHVCGQETAVDLVKRIASSTGEEVEVRRLY